MVQLADSILVRSSLPNISLPKNSVYRDSSRKISVLSFFLLIEPTYYAS